MATSTNYNNTVNDDLLLFEPSNHHQQPQQQQLASNESKTQNEAKLNDSEDCNGNNEDNDDDLGVDLSIETSNPDLTFISDENTKNNDKADRDSKKADGGSGECDLDAVSSLYNKLLINNNQNVNINVNSSTNNDINNECKKLNLCSPAFSNGDGGDLLKAGVNQPCSPTN